MFMSQYGLILYINQLNSESSGGLKIWGEGLELGSTQIFKINLIIFIHSLPATQPLHLSTTLIIFQCNNNNIQTITIKST